MGTGDLVGECDGGVSDDGVDREKCEDLSGDPEYGSTDVILIDLMVEFLRHGFKGQLS